MKTSFDHDRGGLSLRSPLVEGHTVGLLLPAAGAKHSIRRILAVLMTETMFKIRTESLCAPQSRNVLWQTHPRI